MDDEILEKLLTKLIGLTEFGALRWHFAGDVSKAYVTVYKDARLKLTEQALDITEPEQDTVRIDARLHEGLLKELLNGLLKAAKESSGRFRTGQVKTVTSTSTDSLVSTCQRLLDDEEQLVLCACLICSEQFDPEKSMGHLSQQDAQSDKSFYICHDCVSKVGMATAQAQLERAIRSARTRDDEAINGETLSDVLSPQNEVGQTTGDQARKNPGSR